MEPIIVLHLIPCSPAALVAAQLPRNASLFTQREVLRTEATIGEGPGIHYLQKSSIENCFTVAIDSNPPWSFTLSSDPTDDSDIYLPSQPDRAPIQAALRFTKSTGDEYDRAAFHISSDPSSSMLISVLDPLNRGELASPGGGRRTIRGEGYLRKPLKLEFDDHHFDIAYPVDAEHCDPMTWHARTMQVAEFMQFSRDNHEFRHIDRPLGSGAFGDVDLVVDIISGRLMAVKTAVVPYTATVKAQVLENEIRMLEKITVLDCKHIVRLEGVSLQELPPKQGRVYEIYCTQHHGDTADLIETGIAPVHFPAFARDVTTALDRLHNDATLMHRDIKPANIFFHILPLGEDGFEKVCKDEALSQSSTKLRFILGDVGLTTRDDSLPKERCGTESYMAPEIFEGVYGRPADIFALGMTFRKTLQPSVVVEPYQRFKRARARGDASELELLKKYHQRVRKAPAPSFVSQEFWNLTERMISHNPERRPTILDVQEVCQRLHVFTADRSPITSSYVMRDGIMNFGPKLRIGLLGEMDVMDIDGVAHSPVAPEIIQRRGRSVGGQGGRGRPRRSTITQRQGGLLHSPTHDSYVTSGVDQGETVIAIRRAFPTGRPPACWPL